MKTCLSCRRWRPTSDYGARDGAGPLRDYCVPCRRRDDVHVRAEAAAAKRRAVVARARAKVERGEAVWLTGELIEWLVRKGAEHSWEQLARWGGCVDKTLRLATRDPDRLTLDVGIIDRIVLHEGSTSLGELCAA